VGSYLITGGAGFIGSHLSRRILADGHSVTVLDNLSTGRMENIAELEGGPRFRFVRGDVLNRNDVAPLVADVGTVYHLAASVGVLKIMEQPVETIANNVRGTETVLEAITTAPGAKRKILVASTSEVYGKTPEMPFLEEGNLVMGAPTNIRWGYAASKMVDEFLAFAFHRQFGVPAVVVRPFNTIGPRQVGNYGMVVPRLIEQAIRGEELTIYGDGSQTRCFTYVSDTVEWLYRLMQTDQAVGEVFNLGNPFEISIRGLAERILRITGSSSKVRLIPYETAYRPGFEDMHRRVPTIDKVVAVTGHAPAVQLDEAIERCHEWILREMGAPAGPATGIRR
jgi:UDP-glucose 4-epimerase